MNILWLTHSQNGFRWLQPLSSRCLFEQTCGYCHARILLASMYVLSWGLKCYTKVDPFIPINWITNAIKLVILYLSGLNMMERILTKNNWLGWQRCSDVLVDKNLTVNLKNFLFYLLVYCVYKWVIIVTMCSLIVLPQVYMSLSV